MFTHSYLRLGEDRFTLLLTSGSVIELTPGKSFGHSLIDSTGTQGLGDSDTLLLHDKSRESNSIKQSIVIYYTMSCFFMYTLFTYLLVDLFINPK